MKHSEEEVVKALKEILAEGNISKTVDVAAYRDDYQDYQVLLNRNSHAEIREKLINDYFEFSKNADIKREICYLCEHAVPYEEWELEEMDLLSSEDDRIDVDKSDQYDFL